MNKKIINNQEFENFSKISNEWWKPNGKFKILHEIAPIRLKYILENLPKKNVKDLSILDLGCGGGLICEPLAKLKAKVTGIDFVNENIEVARFHAKKEGLKINYINADLSNFASKKKYDLILMLEIIEHLDDWGKIIVSIKKNLNKNGILIISSINRTQIARFFAIFLAEEILKWVPKKTHNYNKLVKPDDLKKHLIKNGFSINNITGMNFNPILRKWELNKKKFPINYFCTAKLI
tara:strand:- start:225 stop:932 length:708 start_codon:yes stop_codon:yes gene_type:complete